MAKLSNIQTTIAIPINFSKDQIDLVARAIIDKIQSNTKDGISRYGTKFPKYSKEYKESLDFKNAGKTSSVDLELTGDMMASLEVISSKPGQITIGYKASHPDADKVEGNQIGSYGQPDPNPAKARPFIGLPQDDIDLIIAKVKSETESKSLFNSALDNLVSNLLGRVKNEP